MNLNANVENIRQPAVSFIPESFNFSSLLYTPSRVKLDQITTTPFLSEG